jgi:hypothetical protein
MTAAENAIINLRSYEESLRTSNLEYTVTDGTGAKVQTGVLQKLNDDSLNRYKYFDDPEIVRVVRSDASFDLQFNSPKWIPNKLSPGKQLDRFPAVEFFSLPFEVGGVSIADMIADYGSKDAAANQKPLKLTDWVELDSGRWRGVVQKEGKAFCEFTLDANKNWVCTEQKLGKVEWQLDYDNVPEPKLKSATMRANDSLRKTIQVTWLDEKPNRDLFRLTAYGLSESLLESPSQTSRWNYLPLGAGLVGCLLVITALVMRFRANGS